MDNALSIVKELVQQYGQRRKYGWFNSRNKFPKDLDLLFLTHTLEQLGFGIEMINGRLPFTLDGLCNDWQELKDSNNPIVRRFVQNKWSKTKKFGEKFDQSIQKDYNNIYRLRHNDKIKRGAKGLRLFRALLKNAWTIKHGQFVDSSSRSPKKTVEYGSFLEFLEAKTEDYLRFQFKLQDDQPCDAMKEFPHFKSLSDEEFKPKLYARFLENKIANSKIKNSDIYERDGETKAFEETGLNTASYALRDIAIENGEQILRGTEYCFKVDSNAKNYVLEKGLLYHSIKLVCSLAIKEVDDNEVLRDSAWYERKVHEMLLDAIVDNAKEKYPSLTPAKLNERFYLFMQGK